ncbi:lipopolysaccharide biosynthesis protein [Pseudoalteromonas lipolytica]
MSQTAIESIEKRFTALHDSTSEEVWNDGDKLFELAEEIEKNDIYLARRVLQRVRTLQPKRPKLTQHLKRLSDEIEKSSKQAQTSSSSEYQPATENKKISLKSIVELAKNNKLWNKPWLIALIFPFLLFAFYQLVWAAPRYESRAQLIVQQPDGMSTMDPSMALLSGLGVGSNSGADSEIAKAYIHSEDMLNYLEKHSNLKAHYQQGGDLFSKLSNDASKEDLLQFYIEHTTVEIDDASGVLKVLVQAYTPEFANTLTQTVIDRAEWYINSIGHQLAAAQLKFIRSEHAKVELRLRNAQKQLLAFQQKHNLLDPEAEGLALQQITYGLEGQIATKSAELKGLLSTMTNKAPQVVMLEAEIDALKTQLELERERLSQQQGSSQTESGIALSEVLAQYSDLKIELELALKGYTASEVSLDKARIEAYRQLKYLVVVESATLPEDHQYPDALYNILLFLVIQVMFIGIVKIILATVNELR